MWSADRNIAIHVATPILVILVLTDIAPSKLLSFYSVCTVYAFMFSQ